MFCGENRSQDCYIRLALDSFVRTINVSDRPRCFAARFDQIFVVQVSNEFSTGAKVLLNYLVIYISLCIVCSKLFYLGGEC
jgi:hypothetical protein